MILTCNFQERRKSRRVLNDSALVGDVIPVVSPLLLEWSRSSSPARVTPLATGMSNSMAVVLFLATAVVVQWMEVNTTFLHVGPLDTLLKLRLHLRYLSQKNESCVIHVPITETSFSFLHTSTSCHSNSHSHGFCSLFWYQRVKTDDLRNFDLQTI